MGFEWINDISRKFLDGGYLVEGQNAEERIQYIGDYAGNILDDPNFSSAFMENMSKGWYSLSSPIWSNFGLKRGLGISCFNSYVDDSMSGILDTAKEVGMMSKYGGGTSGYFGDVRSRGSKITDNGTSDGAVNFMRLFNTLIDVTKQGSCYVEGAEVLTNHGFKDFRDINSEDLLAQVDNKNLISFTTEYELTEKDYNGEITCITGKKREGLINLAVTNNHRMVINRRKGSHHRDNKGQVNKTHYWSEETEFVKAEDLKLHRDNRIPRAGFATGGDDYLSYVEQLKIAYQADGFEYNHKKHGLFKYGFRFTKIRKINRCINILKTLISAKVISEYIEETKGDVVEISFNFDHALSKKLSKSFTLEDFSHVKAHKFIEELKHWDGTFEDKNLSYSCVDKENASFVQAVASLCNLRTTFSVRPAHDNRQDLYSVTVCKLNTTQGESCKIDRRHYSGKVYCAVVPEGRLVVRQNNSVSICGNTRRGAFAAYLPIDHGDILEFLKIKSEGDPIQGIFTGVCVPDYWMQSMINGDVDKRKVWAMVLRSRCELGLPYIFFSDTVNNNTVDVFKDMGLKLQASNLCSEVMLPSNNDYSFVCNLSSMNIAKFEEWENTNAIEILVNLLDAVMTDFIDRSSKINGFDKANKFARDFRALGIGVLGFHDLLQSKSIAFGSVESFGWNNRVFKNLQEKSYEASKKMYERYGASSVMEPYKRRHATLNTVAPTTSSAFILEQTSQSVEPQRSNYYVKDVAKVKCTIRNKHLEKYLESVGRDTPEVWRSILENGGSVQHIKWMDDEAKKVFRTFNEIPQLDVIKLAGQRQQFLDQGQSLNLMIHPKMDLRDINNLHIEAWKAGVKTLYYQHSINAAQEFNRELLTCSSCEG